MRLGLKSVERAADAESASVEDVGIDHRGPHVLVTQWPVTVVSLAAFGPMGVGVDLFVARRSR